MAIVLGQVQLKLLSKTVIMTKKTTTRAYKDSNNKNDSYNRDSEIDIDKINCSDYQTSPTETLTLE